MSTLTEEKIREKLQELVRAGNIISVPNFTVSTRETRHPEQSGYEFNIHQFGRSICTIKVYYTGGWAPNIKIKDNNSHELIIYLDKVSKVLDTMKYCLTK